MSPAGSRPIAAGPTPAGGAGAPAHELPPCDRAGSGQSGDASASSTAGARPPLDPAEESALLAAARAARANAYAPYSNFQVGAAVLDESGRVHAGCNVENAAHPEGLCAEAGALAAMVLAGGRRACALAVVGPGPGWTTPCGGCRQKLREFAGEDTPVLVADMEQLQARFTLGELLAHAFGPDRLAAR